MNRMKFTLLFFASILFFGAASAQPCANPEPRCTPVGNLQGPGFQNPDSIPCAVQGEAYDYPIQLLMFSDFSLGTSVTVDSVKFKTISNLPCGLCWSTSKPSNTYAANERGCIRITGTTNDSVGQYKLIITLDAWISNNPVPIPTNAGLVDAAGIKMYLRVKGDSGECVPVDTASSAPSVSANCVTAINNITNDISVLNVLPNPVNNNAIVAFSSVKAGDYTMIVTDVTGKILQSKQVEVMAGQNRIALNRQQMQAGLYFISISNGTSAITRKFSVID